MFRLMLVKLKIEVCRCLNLTMISVKPDTFMFSLFVSCYFTSILAWKSHSLHEYLTIPCLILLFMFRDCFAFDTWSHWLQEYCIPLCSASLWFLILVTDVTCFWLPDNHIGFMNIPNLYTLIQCEILKSLLWLH